MIVDLRGINEEYRMDIEDAIKLMQREYPVLQDIIFHEMGHALQGFYLCRKMNISLKWYKFFID